MEKDKSQLPQTDPHDSLRYGHLLYTTVDAQCDNWQPTTIASLSHCVTTPVDSICDGQLAVANIYKSEFGTKFQSDVHFWRYLNSLPKQ